MDLLRVPSTSASRHLGSLGVSEGARLTLQNRPKPKMATIAFQAPFFRAQVGFREGIPLVLSFVFLHNHRFFFFLGIRCTWKNYCKLLKLQYFCFVTALGFFSTSWSVGERTVGKEVDVFTSRKCMGHPSKSRKQPCRKGRWYTWFMHVNIKYVMNNFICNQPTTSESVLRSNPQRCFTAVFVKSC